MTDVSNAVNLNNDDGPEDSTNNVVDLQAWRQTHLLAPLPGMEQYDPPMRLQAENIRLSAENRQLSASLAMTEMAGSVYASLVDVTEDTMKATMGLTDEALRRIEQGDTNHAKMLLNEAMYMARARLQRTAEILKGHVPLNALVVGGICSLMLSRVLEPPQAVCDLFGMVVDTLT